MNSIDYLEHGGTGLSIRYEGEVLPLPDPRDKGYQWVLACLGVRHVAGLPNMPEWKRALVFDRWRSAWQLPEFAEARRLAYLVDHYREGITFDLHVYAHADLGTLWRERRWDLLLILIDRLPAHSWYASSVAQDEEHAKMLAEVIANRPPDAGDKSASPALTTWSPEVSVLTNIYDAVRGVQHAVVAVQAGKKAPEPPKPAPRPLTALDKAIKRAEFERKQANHKALVARVLPHKTDVKTPS